MSRIPTMIEYLDNEWEEGDGLPGPAYTRKYGVSSYGPEACGETQKEWDARMARNEKNSLPNLAPPKNCAPTPMCICGQMMTHQNWIEFDIEGGKRIFYGVSCSTDGCQGNFPQMWARIINGQT